MIIQCGKCGTKYRFDEAQIDGEGAWVRCSRCRDVFFQENPSETGEARVSSEREAASAKDMKTGALQAGLPESPLEETGTEKESGLSTQKKILAVAVVLLVVAVGLFFWFLPQTGKRMLESVPGWSVVAGSLGIEKSKYAAEGGIDFLDVRESFIKNWLIGDIMVIHGTAVNRYSHPVSKIHVRAKLLDAQGRSVGETESYCGNFFSDDDLAKMTKKEITEKIAASPGRDIPGPGVAPAGKVPFVLVFMNPPKNAVEYIVEMVSAAPGGTK
jgi:predicted Zn finger-like uncharacterized protein